MPLLPRIAACLFMLSPAPAAFAGTQLIGLGSAASFAVLAGSDVTNTGATVVNGDLGIWPNNSITGFPPGLVMNGAIYAGDLNAMLAQAGIETAYQTASGETGAQSLSGENLGGLTLSPGVYAFSSSAQLTGTLTLNAGQAANAVFIFQIASTLNTAPDAVVELLNFAPGDQVIWQVGSSATLGTDTVFGGDILAFTSITLNSGAGIACGGAFALNGAVTLDDNAVSTAGAACQSARPPIPEPATFPVFLAVGFSLTALGRARRPATAKPRTPQAAASPAPPSRAHRSRAACSAG